MELAVAGKQVIKLICVTADNNNKYYNMYEQGNGQFIAQYGRIKGTAVTHTYPMSDWDKIYREKTKASKGYKDVTHLFTETIAKKLDEADGNPIKIAQIQNAMVKKLIDDLQAFAKKTVKENYTVSQDDVTQAQVDEAQGVINEISKHIAGSTTEAELNKHLLHLYTIIPRKMDNVRNYLLKGYTTAAEKSAASKLIETEQKLLDTMAGQVELIRKEREAQSKMKDPKEVEKTMNTLDVMGISVEEADAKDIEKIKKLLGPNANQFRAAFRVINKGTQAAFDKHLASAKDKKTELFWHGSRNENWFNILQSGLLIRPSGAVYTGSMFGDGVYFADKAQKSIGYCSLNGSCWARGNSNKGYLALYDVHVGNQKHIHKHDSSCYSLSNTKLHKEGFDSVFAHGGADLRNNEYIVYNIAQTTIRYIVELGN